MAEEALEPLVAARLDERGHEQEVEALLGLALLSARGAELGHVEIAPRREHRRAEAARLARDLAEVAQLLGRERREPVDERRAPRVRADERQRLHRGLQLADGVIGDESGQVLRRRDARRPRLGCPRPQADRNHSTGTEAESVEGPDAGAAGAAEAGADAPASFERFR